MTSTDVQPAKTAISNIIKPFQIEPERIEINRNVQITKGDEEEADQLEEEDIDGRRSLFC